MDRRTVPSWLLRSAVSVAVAVSPLLLRADTSVLVSAIVQIINPPPIATKVVFHGFAFPNSRVTIQQDGMTKVEVPADPAAKFDVELNDVSAGTHSYDLFARDTDGRLDRSSNFVLTISEGTTTTLSGVFLGPTIAVDKQSAELGDTITMLGQTVPQSAVSIVVNSETQHTFAANADASGVWSYQFVTNDIGVGTHSARAKATAPTHEVSAYSDSVSFAVVQGAPKPCDGKRPGDLNCDGKVNITDFGILLFFWKSHTPSNPRADINADGIVDIRDFSSMLYWWTA